MFRQQFSLLSLAQGQCVFKKGNGAHIMLREVNLGRESVCDGERDRGIGCDVMFLGCNKCQKPSGFIVGGTRCWCVEK